ncbi:MAG TPA: acyl-CoA dehydrogenase family protein [Ktedonobacteraceae bacterium]|nr:acyl-CoA dehydrogenase family protein [Ktedonobacteraceae bacterium]
MKMELTAEQRTSQESFRAFVEEAIVPYADGFDQEEYTPPDLIKKIGQQGYLGALIAPEWGGRGMDMITFGILNEEFGRGCSSLRSLLTVHSMVTYAIQRWGDRRQKEHWLPRLAAGEAIGAFALSEPNAGSDARGIETHASLRGDTYILNGRKKWITYGEIADVYLLFAQCEGTVSAFLVESNSPGFSRKPIRGMVGTRASMIAELILEDCQVPATNAVGKKGFGVASVTTSALDIGRYSVACGCVGIIQACFEASRRYTSERKQFDTLLKNQQLIQQMMTGMITNLRAARLLCYNAGYLKDIGAPNTIMETWIAKYFASTAAARIASDAVQIHGANGCSSDYPVQRYWRDTKVMEIIEGSTQIQEINIAGYGYQGLYA